MRVSGSGMGQSIRWASASAVWLIPPMSTNWTILRSQALQGIDTWIVDALRYHQHPTHANVETALRWIDRVKPRRAVLTNFNIDIDYAKLAAELPPGVEPAYDGMVVTAPL